MCVWLWTVDVNVWEWTHSLWGSSYVLRPCIPYKFMLLRLFSQQTRRIFTSDKTAIQCQLTHDSRTSRRHLWSRWMGQTAHRLLRTCICTAFLVFNSPQLTVSIVTGWEELKTEKDIQDIWCPALPPLQSAVMWSMMCGLPRSCKGG